jgi:hypothetical protein
MDNGVVGALPADMTIQVPAPSLGAPERSAGAVSGAVSTHLAEVPPVVGRPDVHL